MYKLKRALTMNENKFWEIVYPYISRIVELTDNTEASQLKIEIENNSNFVLHQNQELYQGCIFTKEDVIHILIDINLMQIRLSLNDIREDEVKTRLETSYKIKRLMKDSPKIILSTATPMMNNPQEIKELMSYLGL